MNEQRLLETATLLYFVALHKGANAHFNMKYYRRDLPPVPICHTAACALGYTAEMYPEAFEWIRKTFEEDLGQYFDLVLKGDERKDIGRISGIDAGAVFFEIPPGDANLLFAQVGRSDRSAKEEADIICQYVEKEASHA